MSGPGGSVTRRDQRRETRRDQYVRRQAERQAERQRKIRRQRVQRYSIIGGVVVLVLLLALAVSQFVIHSRQPASLPTSPATGQTVDGLQCLSAQGGGLHHHQYLDLYVNGQRVDANPGVGIVNSANCLYPLHVHDNEANIIHNESDQANASFTLGQFFDIWGMPLSNTQVGSNKVNSAHKLVVKVIDGSGKVTTYSGNPHNLVLQDHQTIYVLYNSPNVTLTPFTNWQTLNE